MVLERLRLVIGAEMKKLLSFLLFGPLLANAAGNNGISPEIQKKLADFKPGISRKVIYNTGFEAPFGINGIKAKGYSLAREGINGSGCLKFTRSNPAEYSVFAIPLDLKAQTDYTVEFYARGENLRRHNGYVGVGLVCIEYTLNGKYVKGEYPSIMPTEEFKKYTLKVSTASLGKRKFDKAHIAFYLRKDWTGTAWIDDLTVTGGRGETHAVVVNEPKMLTFRNQNGKFKLVCDSRFGTMLGAHVTLRNGGKVRELLLKSDKIGVLECDFGTLTVGNADMDVQLLDLNKKLFLEKQQFNFSVRPADDKIPANAAFIDKYGRLIVNGKPFMPVGCYGYAAARSLKMIEEAGFNCLLDYTNVKSDRQKIISMLDLVQKHDLKYIFSLIPCEPGSGGVWYNGKKGELDILEKIVADIRNHPALLAYYIGDERPLGALPNLVKMREAINKLDVWHPAYVVSMVQQSYLFPQYAVAMDIGGLDIYPYGINDKNIIPQLKQHIEAYKKMDKAHLPHWCVPQMFNWGSYKAKNKEEYKKFRWPTPEEMRIQTLIHAILGARGFIFYSQSDIIKADRFEPGISQKRMAMAKELTSMLRKLEPYIMSVRQAPAIKVKTDNKNNLLLRAFSDENGKLCIIAAAFGPVNAEITLPANANLKSEYGRFKKISDNCYRFTAKNIDSDILFPAQ